MEMKPSRDPSTRGQQGKAGHMLVYLRNRLLAGIAVAVPVIVTVWVINIGYNFIKGITAPFWRAVGLEIPGLAFVTTLLLLIFLGFMATHVIGRTILDRFEKLMLRVPLVATVYGGVKQLLDSFKGTQNASRFKRVAYVPYLDGHLLLGFVTGELYDAKLGKTFTTVFVPTAPNPMTGILIMVPEEKVIDAGLTLEQAWKLVVSAGIVAPTRSAVSSVEESEKSVGIVRKI